MKCGLGKPVNYLPVVNPIKAFSPPSKPVIHQALMGPSFLAGTPPANLKINHHSCKMSSLHKPMSHFCSCKMAFLTIHTRVVIINRFDNTAKVQLHVLLNQPRIKGTEVAVLVIYTEGHNS